MKFADHSTVRAYKQGKNDSPKSFNKIMESAKLKQIELAASADDAGIIDLSRECLARQKQSLSSGYALANPTYIFSPASHYSTKSVIISYN